MFDTAERANCRVGLTSTLHLDYPLFSLASLAEVTKRIKYKKADHASISVTQFQKTQLSLSVLTESERRVTIAKLFNVPVAQLDRALASGAKGRAFESPQAYPFSILQLSKYRKNIL